MTTPIREIMAQEVAEGGSCLITGTLKDELGVPVPLASIGTAQVWLDNEATGATINSRSAQSVKNVNGGTIHATSGAFTLALGPLDNPIVNSALRKERHLVTLKFSYNGGSGVLEKEAVITVRNLSRSP